MLPLERIALGILVGKITHHIEGIHKVLDVLKDEKRFQSVVRIASGNLVAHPKQIKLYDVIWDEDHDMHCDKRIGGICTCDETR